MDHPLKILHLEDLAADVEIVDRILRKANFSFEMKVVADKPGFIRALHEFQPDIILSDHSLPAFNSMEALEIKRAEGIAAPLILVTATVSEEYAVQVIKEGASDYVLKDRLERLPNAMLNALDKRRMEVARQTADEALRSSEQKHKLLFQANPMPMWMFSLETLRIIDANEAAIAHYGYSKEEFLSLKTGALWNDWNPGLYCSGIWKHKKKNGTIIDVEVIAHKLVHDNEKVMLILAIDITEKLRAQAALAKQSEIQRKLITQTSIQVQEKEREEIGKELHDNINQILAATKMYLDIALNESSEEGVSRLLLKSHQHLNKAMEEIRHLSQSLVAPSLGNVRLDRAIASLANGLPDAASFHLSVDATAYNGDIADEGIKLTCYRIVQVQLSNIIKHAQAQHVTIQLRKTNNVELTIADDGIGFLPGKDHWGIGLRNIRNRVDFYSGSMNIVSEPGNGCILTATIPLRATVG